MKLGHTIEDSRAKYPELTDDLLNELRAWSEKHCVPGIPDAQLGIFAHSCYYDVEATKRCMSVYYRMRSTLPEFFANRDPRNDTVLQASKTCVYVTLPEPDSYGNRIIFHRLTDYQPSAYVMNDAIKLLLMTVDASLYNEGCSPGYVFVLDMTGVKLAHLTRISIVGLRKFVEYIQEGLPVRLKAIHVTNCVWFIDKVLAIIRPFMNRELLELLHLHVGEVSQIYEHIKPKYLPKDLGGELESAATLHEEHWGKLNELRDYFCEEERLFRSWSRNGSGKRRPSTASTGSAKEDNKVSETVDGETGNIKQ